MAWRDNWAEAWYIRRQLYRCTSPAGVRLETAASESEARASAARQVGAPPESFRVEAVPGSEQYRFLCRGTDRDMETGGPRVRERK